MVRSITEAALTVDQRSALHFAAESGAAVATAVLLGARESEKPTKQVPTFLRAIKAVRNMVNRHVSQNIMNIHHADDPGVKP